MNKQKWIEEVKKNNSDIDSFAVESLWNYEQKLIKANEWCCSGENLISYATRENRLRLCEIFCLSLSENIDEFYGIWCQVRRIRKEHEKS